MKVGLYFGSFNPIHIGHLIIAEFVANNTDLDQVWLIVSPQNPLKPSSSLLNEYDRLHMVQVAVQDNPMLKASDIEFRLPKPSYTIDTLQYLKEKFPAHEYSIIMGSDSFQNLPKWKNYELLIKNYHFIIYSRPGCDITTNLTTVNVLQAPLLDISSTQIRATIKAKKSIRYLVHPSVATEIETNGYYK